MPQRKAVTARTNAKLLSRLRGEINAACEQLASLHDLEEIAATVDELTQLWQHLRAAEAGEQPAEAPAQFFSAKRNGDVGEIDVFDYVGWPPNTATDFAEALDELGEVSLLRVRIDSPGGAVSSGTAIYNMLKDHPAPVDVKIIGAAWSMGSIIAMAGDRIAIADNATMMVHHPWTIALGNHKDFERMANALKVLSGALASTYVKRTKKPKDEVIGWMDEETWFDAEAARDAGLADQVEEAETEESSAASSAIFQIANYRHAPDAVVASLRPQSPPRAIARTTTMPKGAAATTETPETEGTPTAADMQAAQSAAVTAERERVASITQAAKPYVANQAVVALRDKAITEGWTAEQAYAAMLTALGQGAAPANPQNTDPTIEAGQDARDKFRAAVTPIVVARGTPNDATGQKLLRDGQNPWRGLVRISDLARACLERAGVNAAGMIWEPGNAGERSLIQAAITHTSSDFTLITKDAAHKGALMGWDEAEETWRVWTGRRNLVDFKTMNIIGLSAFSSLDLLSATGEYKYGTFKDYGETISLGTYGKLFSINRQALINDDLSLFAAIPRGMGRAAARVPGDLVYGILTGNPTMSDGVALFHATHGNLVASGSGAGPSVNTYNAAMVAMDAQKDASTNQFLGISPRWFLGPSNLFMAARKLFAMNSDPAATANLDGSNIFAGRIEPVKEPRLSANSATKWYLAAAANQGDTIDVGFLNGVEAPFIDTKDGWTVDGVEYKVRLDTAAAATDYRGLYHNFGS